MALLKRVREFIGEVSKDPQYGTDGSLILTEVGRLEIVIKLRAVRQTLGSSDQVCSTRSVVMSLARRFNAGISWLADLVA